MSLQVWLPLNGDLNNQGLNDIAFTNSNATVEANGKLGKCYKCGILYANDFTLNTEEFSVCYWVKYNWIGTWNTYVVSLNNSTSNDYQFMVGSLGNGTDNSAKSTYLRINAVSSGTIPIPVGEWHHCCATWKGTTVSLYVDGVFDKKITGVKVNSGATHLGINCRSNSTSGSGVSNTGSSGIYVNDVRIYDHCLSLSEIREIYKGLSNHYKLTNLRNPNMITTMTNGGRTTLKGKYGLNADFSQNMDTYGYFNVSPALNLGSTYTLSFDVSNFPKGGSWGWKLWNNANYATPYVNKNGHYIYTFTPDSSKLPEGYSLSKFLFDDSGRTNPAGIVKFRNFKIEKGSQSTPWCPSESDEEYYLLGYAGDNLLPNTDLSGHGWENPSGSAVLQSNGYYKVTYTGGGWWGSRYPVTLEAGKTYVATGWGYGTKTQMWFYKDSTNNKGGNINTTTTPTFLTVKYTPEVSGSYYIACYTANGNENYYRDISFYCLDNVTREVDCSGFLNNAERVGEISADSDSPRYEICYKFTGSQYLKFTNPLSSSSTEFSISVWAYFDSDSTTSTLFCARTYLGKGISLFKLSTNLFRLDDGSLKTTFDYTIPLNTWLHITVTRNSSSKNLYINGELKQSTSSVGDMSDINSVATVGASQVSMGTFDNFHKGKLSDFRLYTTCLSSEEVKRLYGVSASIDNQGNLYSCEFVER